MAVQSIVYYGGSILRKQCEPVTDFEALRKLLPDMWDSMYEADGIGLAANQIGLDLHFFVIDVTHTEDADEPMVFTNGRIVNSRGSSEYGEGCLSLPGIQLNITRPEFVTLEYQDENGVQHTQEFGGMLARAIQHELDHVNGKLMIDHVSEIVRMKYRQQLKAIRNNGGTEIKSGTTAL